MLIFAIDDEPKMLRLLHRAIEEAAPEAAIMDFLLSQDALKAVTEQELRPDVVFSDIQMPPPTGLEFAVKLKKIAPRTKVVFVTGYEQYAAESYQIHAEGYILKPVRAQRIKEELEHIAPVSAAARQDRLTVRCFGYFEVFWNNEPLSFSRSKTKELFALLIDRRGSSCTAEEAIAALYEDTSQETMKNAKQNLRNLVNDMKNSLSAIGMSDVLIRRGSILALRTGLIDCDYLRMISGDMNAVNSYHGEYMEQYSWAELTKGTLEFRRIE